MAEHALLSPSAAERWMNCPGSVELNTTAPRIEKAYSIQGTVAHKLGELCLARFEFDARDPLKITALKSWLDYKKFKHPPVLDDTFFDAVQVYLDYAKSVMFYESGESKVVQTEQKVDLTNISPNTFGYSDLSVYDVLTKTLHVIDYKNGFTYVDAKGNKQLMLYGFGAANLLLAQGLEIEKVKLVIVAPLVNGGTDEPVSEWEISMDDLCDIMESDFKPAAKKAMQPGAPLESGFWCSKTFCPSKATCPARINKLAKVTKTNVPDIVSGKQIVLPDPKHLSKEEISNLYIFLQQLSGYKSAVEDLIKDTLTKGKDMPLHKLVESRGNRTWVDETKAQEKLKEMGFGEDEYTTKKFKTVAQVEKIAGKKDFKDMWHKPLRGTAVALKTDKRPSLKPTAQEDFTISEKPKTLNDL